MIPLNHLKPSSRDPERVNVKTLLQEDRRTSFNPWSIGDSNKFVLNVSIETSLDMKNKSLITWLSSPLLFIWNSKPLLRVCDKSNYVVLHNDKELADTPSLVMKKRKTLTRGWKAAWIRWVSPCPKQQQLIIKMDKSALLDHVSAVRRGKLSAGQPETILWCEA